MALPTLSTPTYELTVPSTKKKIKYRPFLVKEEKVLLLALESEDDKEIANAMKGLIKACVLTKGIDPDELATFDVEYIFLNIRGKSIGEDIDGVDLNRNYDFNWIFGDDLHALDGGCSGNPSYISHYDYYRGEYPFSEKENQAIRDFKIEKKFLVSFFYSVS